MVTLKRAETDTELQQILDLQEENLPVQLSATEKATQGFVTVQHSLKLLKEMNDSCAHIIAVEKKRVVGYSLCMTVHFASRIKVLQSMFAQINSVIKPGIAYLIMGQVCIAKKHRGRGLFRELYQFKRKALRSEYEWLITEVSHKNTRSLNAHKALGFEELKRFKDKERLWILLGWKW